MPADFLVTDGRMDDVEGRPAGELSQDDAPDEAVLDLDDLFGDDDQLLDVEQGRTWLRQQPVPDVDDSHIEEQFRDPDAARAELRRLTADGSL